MRPAPPPQGVPAQAPPTHTAPPLDQQYPHFSASTKRLHNKPINGRTVTSIVDGLKHIYFQKVPAAQGSGTGGWGAALTCVALVR